MTSTSADSVNVTSRHTVRCANETSWTALDSPFRLGPLDQLVSQWVPIAVVFVYEQQPTSATFDDDVELIIPVERLQRALTLLLDYYPHLTGRLQINPSDGTPEITRLGTGAELFIARCSERLDAFSTSPRRILMPNLPAAGNALLAPFDATLEGLCHDPIFTVQHTRFGCGGVALGVRLRHSVCDADGFFQLVHDLVELYRGVRSSSEIINVGDPTTSGVPSLSHPPHIRSYMSELMSGDNLTPEERLAALDFQPSLFYVEPSAADASSSSSTDVTASTFPASPPVVGRFLYFSSRELNALKAHATDPNAGSSPSLDSSAWISTFDALSAHLYQCVYRARLQQLRASNDQGEMLSPPDFLTPVNLRTRLGHDCLPPRYFPNALFCPFTTLPLDVLANGALWQVAKALHDLTRGPSTTSKEEMIQTLKWIAVQSDKRKIRHGFRYGNGSFMVSQWNKFEMYASAVFEEDPPLLVSSPFTPISLVDGLVYFLPTEEQGAGAIDVNLALSEPLWDILDQDEEFRRFRDA